MPTALTQPTGAQIIANLPIETGGIGTIGTLKAATIDTMVAANPLTNPVRKAFNAIKEVVSDWATLPDERYPFAYRALFNAIGYELLAADSLTRGEIPNADGGGLNILSYESKMQYFATECGLQLKKLGITSSDYHFDMIATAERIGGSQELNLTYNPDIYGSENWPLGYGY